MNTVTVVLVLLSLALSGVAYWRSGGAQDVEKLRAEFESLRLKQQELTKRVADSLSAAYGRTRARLQVADSSRWAQWFPVQRANGRCPLGQSDQTRPTTSNSHLSTL